MPRPFPPLALALALIPQIASAEQIFHEDIIIDGYLCVGENCTANDANYETPIKIKSNNPNIRFLDGSSSPYPGRDWQLRINTPRFNGQSRFAIYDEGADTTPFTVQGGGPNNALYIDDAGDVGLGTSLPSRDLHIVRSQAPVIRLENDGTGAGHAQIWDLVAYPDYFFLSDSTDGSYPVFIEKAPTNTLRLSARGFVGIGSSSPAAPLHVLGSDNSAAILVEETGAGTLGQLTLRNNGITYFTLEDTSIADADYSGRAWNFQNQNGTFRVTTAPGGPGEIEMLLTPQGDMHIKGQLYTGTGGTSTTCASGCDAVFDESYELPSFADHMAAIRENGHLPAVGPTDEDGPHNLSQMVGGTLNELEKAYLYIDRLQDRDSDRAAQIADLSGTMAQMQDMIAQQAAQIAALQARLEQGPDGN